MFFRTLKAVVSAFAGGSKTGRAYRRPRVVRKTLTLEKLEGRELFAADVVQAAAIDDVSITPVIMLPGTLPNATIFLPNGVSPIASSTSSLANDAARLDVNGDGRVSTLDVQQIFAAMSSHGGNGIVDVTTKAGEPFRGLDINHDGFVTPQDGLLIINYMNRGQHDATPAAISRDPLDVDGSGFVDTDDATAILDWLHTDHGSSPIADSHDKNGNLIYPDVDGDGEVTPTDLLRVINKINRPTDYFLEHDADSVIPVLSYLPHNG